MSNLGIWREPSPDKRNIEKASRVTFLVYPDSVIDGWVDYLRDLNLKIVISPLHDQDLNSDGSLQKPHHHVVVDYGHSTSWYSFAEIRDKINAYQHFEKLRSMQNIINYLTHDSYSAQEKFKYSKDDITWLNCCEADFMEDEVLRVINFIEENHMISFRSLIQNLLELGYEGQLLVRWCSKNTVFVNTYLKGFVQRKKD